MILPCPIPGQSRRGNGTGQSAGLKFFPANISVIWIEKHSFFGFFGIEYDPPKKKLEKTAKKRGSYIRSFGRFLTITEVRLLMRFSKPLQTVVYQNMVLRGSEKVHKW